MFRDVPGCSGMFHVPGFIDAPLKQLTLLKMCVTSLLCGPRADLWPFYGFLCKRFSLYIKVYLNK